MSVWTHDDNRPHLFLLAIVRGLWYRVRHWRCEGCLFKALCKSPGPLWMVKSMDYQWINVCPKCVRFWEENNLRIHHG